MDEAEYGKKPRLKAVPAVYLLLIEDGEILLALRQNTGYQDGMWNVPSGHLEGNELPIDALIRESKEEIDADLRAEQLELAHLMYRPQHDPTGPRIDFFFRAYGLNSWRSTVRNAEPYKCAELKRFPLSSLPENTTPHVAHAIQMVNGECGTYCELSLGWLKERGLYKL